MKLKSIHQWLPMIGGGLFLSWTCFLVLYSLLKSPEETNAPATHVQSPQPQPSDCKQMPGGFVICDEITTKEAKP